MGYEAPGYPLKGVDHQLSGIVVDLDPIEGIAWFFGQFFVGEPHDFAFGLSNRTLAIEPFFWPLFIGVKLTPIRRGEILLGV